MRLLKSLFFISIVLLLQACASKTNKQATVFYPPMPDTPRVQFLTSISDERDIGNTNKFNEFLMGKEESTRYISRPFNLSHTDGKLYMVDKTFKKIVIINFEDKTFEQIHDAGRGTLKDPVDIFISKKGVKYVADVGRGQIIVYDKNNQFIRAYGNPGQFRPTAAIVIDEKLYVCDVQDHEIEVLDLKSGKLIKTFGGKGKDDGQFKRPTHLATDAENNIYVTDAFNFRIQKFDQDGKFIKVIGKLGTYPGTFARPKGMDVDRSGNIYSADAAFEIIQVFDNESAGLLLTFGKYGPEPGGTYLPSCVHIDYENVDYFKAFFDKDFKVNYLIYVCNTLGENKINVYGFGEWTGEPLMYEQPVGVDSPATENEQPVGADSPATENEQPVGVDSPATENEQPVGADIPATENEDTGKP